MVDALHTIRAAIHSTSQQADAILVAVSKQRSIEEMAVLYDAGIRDFGENRVQELCQKASVYHDIRWHMIGRLQTNKIKDLLPHVYLLHSLDRMELAYAIEKEAAKQNRIVSALLQVNISKEETKAGFYQEALPEVIKQLPMLPHIRIEGLMCMGPHVDDQAKIKDVFIEAKKLFDTLQVKQDAPYTMRFLSMGMSDDYAIALACGSNMLRIGSLLFHTKEE